MAYFYILNYMKFLLILDLNSYNSLFNTTDNFINVSRKGANLFVSILLQF